MGEEFPGWDIPSGQERLLLTAQPSGRSMVRNEASLCHTRSSRLAGRMLGHLPLPQDAGNFLCSHKNNHPERPPASTAGAPREGSSGGPREPPKSSMLSPKTKAWQGEGVSPHLSSQTIPVPKQQQFKASPGTDCTEMRAFHGVTLPIKHSKASPEQPFAACQALSWLRTGTPGKCHLLCQDRHPLPAVPWDLMH